MVFRKPNSTFVSNNGTEKKYLEVPITLQYVPADTFINIYKSLPITAEVTKMADDYKKNAREMRLAACQDVINGIKSYHKLNNQV